MKIVDGELMGCGALKELDEVSPGKSLHLRETPGTYALILALGSPTEMQIGRLGRFSFDSPFYLYFGSALGPGGLRARIGHHLKPPRRLHWHIDYFRQAADVIGAWYSTETARLECIWASAALADRDVSPIPRFGSSDCSCRSHLLAARRCPSLSAFRHRLSEVRPECEHVRSLQIPG